MNFYQNSLLGLPSTLRTELEARKKRSLTIEVVFYFFIERPLTGKKLEADRLENEYRLDVHLINGTSLAVRDKSGTSDPYVKVIVKLMNE